MAPINLTVTNRTYRTLPYLTSTFTYPQPDQFLRISDSRREKFATSLDDWNSLAHQQERIGRSLWILR